MLPAGDQDVTTLLGRVTKGDRQAWPELFVKTEAALREIARARLAHKLPQQDLQETMLVDDAFLRLVSDANVVWKDRGHFFGFAERVMRQRFLDDIRKLRRKKRGGGKTRACDPDRLAAVPARPPTDADDLRALDAALTRLKGIDPGSSTMVRLRLEGHTFERIADQLGLAVSTAHREWEAARAWLHRELS